MKKTKTKKPAAKKQIKIFGIKLPIKGAANNGALYAIGALGVIGLFAAMSTGGITPTIDKLKTAPTPGPQYTCCDSGNGTDCHPIQEKQITFNGQIYELLKTNIVQGETAHIKPADLVYGGSPQYTPDGHRIFVNSSDTTADYTNIPGCEHGKDLIGVDPKQNNGHECYGLPNEELIYVCTDTAANCSQNVKAHATPFDVYYRVSDGPVPSPISSWCPMPKGMISQSPQQIVGVPTPGGRKNLQLETFQIKQAQNSYDWLGAWCKPAINLYPTKKTTVHVTVAPKGDFNLTIPQYTQDGWNVTAYPDGHIQYNNQTYPYLYYEAAISDKYIQEPTTGYVVAYNKLGDLFNTLLPQLGLSAKEQNDFSTYWLKALPNSPYYFVGVIPQSQIDTMAPLSISPAPDSTLRVSLYFKAVDNNQPVQAPQLTGFTRHGFTVTEWGGIVKTDKNHPFSCLM
jgi:hypothetical protein